MRQTWFWTWLALVACEQGVPGAASVAPAVEASPAAGVCHAVRDVPGSSPLDFSVAEFCPSPQAPSDFGPTDPSLTPADCSEAFRDACPELTKLGLSRTWIQRYVHDAGGPARVEAKLARFVSPEGAFAAFSGRVLVTIDPYGSSAVGVQGFEHAVSMGSSLFAVVGADLVELRYADPWKAPIEEQSTGARVLPEFMHALGSHLPKEVHWPRTVELLPVAKRQPFGVRVNYRRAFGLDGAGPAALGFYEDGPRRYRIFIASYRDEASARDVLRSIRRSGDGRGLEDYPFDCFELSAEAGFGDPPSLWLVGRNGPRVVAVGSAPPKPPGRHSSAARHWLERPEKLQLMRRVFSRR